MWPDHLFEVHTFKAKLAMSVREGVHDKQKFDNSSKWGKVSWRNKKTKLNYNWFDKYFPEQGDGIEPFDYPVNDLKNTATYLQNVKVS